MRDRPRVVVVGGSLGGLTAALVLRDIGCAVTVFERSQTPLMGRGVGIVAHPASVRYIVEHGLANIPQTTTPARWVRYLDPYGAVIDEREFHYRFTSYFALYRDLLAAFDEDRYHLGQEVVGFDQDADAVRVELADGRTVECDLLICADGIRSQARRRLLPDVEREYAGYVAWRGAVGEWELTPGSFEVVAEAIAYYLMPNSHILAYPIPSVDGSVAPGSRFTNWIWYHNVAEGPALDDLMTDTSGRTHEISLRPGTVQEPHVAALRELASDALAPQLAEMVTNTEEPFVQVVFDIEVPRLAFGRICLIGDAACVLRPHVAVGTAKAAEGAWRLAEAVAACDSDVPQALRRWEPAQLELERGALARTREAGIRSQFENSWRAGEPLPFGLYRRGDSSIPASA
jgi:2,6-dihydroxypyridine 3-monooxygenase